MNGVEAERLRCRERRASLGVEGFNRREDLYHEAQRLCTKLVVLPRTVRIDALLTRAENRRERRRLYLRGETVPVAKKVYACDTCNAGPVIEVTVSRGTGDYIVSLPKRCPTKNDCEQSFLTKAGFAGITMRGK